MTGLPIPQKETIHHIGEASLTQLKTAKLHASGHTGLPGQREGVQLGQLRGVDGETFSTQGFNISLGGGA